MAKLTYDIHTGKDKQRAQQQTLVDAIEKRQRQAAAEAYKDYIHNDPEYKAVSAKEGTDAREALEKRKRAEFRRNAAEMNSVELAPLKAAALLDVTTPQSGDFHLQRDVIRNQWDHAPILANPTEAAGIYKSMGYDLLKNTLFNHNAIGLGGVVDDEFMYEPMNYGSTQTKTQMLAGLQNVYAQGLADTNMADTGRAMFWDLETTGSLYEIPASGGRMAGGRDMGSIITEFSMSDITGTYGSTNVTIHDTYNSIIGATQGEYKYYNDLIDKFDKNPNSLTDAENVTLERLALHGNKATTLQEGDVGHFKGVYRFGDFAEKKNILFDAAEMRAGANFLYDIGNKQRAAGLVSYGGEDMLGHEAEMFLGFDTAIQKNLTAVGHNTSNFDMKQLVKYLYSGKMSNGGQNYAMKLLQGHGSLFANQFDTNMVGREFARDRNAFMNKMFAAFGVTDEAMVSNYKDQLNAWMHTNKHFSVGGQTEFTQEALLHAYEIAKNGGKPIQNGAHSAIEDAKGLAAVLFGSTLFSDKDKNSIIPTSANRAAAKGTKDEIIAARKIQPGKQLYTAISNGDAAKSGITVVAIDPLTGELMTNDAISLNAQGGAMEELWASGQDFKKRTLYEVTGSGKITKDSPLYDGFKKLHKDFTGASFISWKTAYNDADNGLQEVQFALIGNHDAVQQHVATHVRLAGTKHDGSDKYDQKELSLAEKQEIDYIKVADPVLGKGDGAVEIEAALNERQRYEYRNIPEKDWTEDTKKAVDKAYKEQKERKAVSLHANKQNGASEDLGSDLKNLVQDSSFTRRNETAAREQRGFNYKKDKAIVDYLGLEERYTNKAMDEARKKGKSFSIADARREFYNKLLDNSNRYAKAIAEHKIGQVSKKEKTLTFQHIFGFGTSVPEGNGVYSFQKVYSTTVQKSLARKEYIRSNIGVIQGLIEQTDAIVQGNGTDFTGRKQAVYNAMGNSVMSYVMHDAIPEDSGFNAQTKASRQAKSKLGYQIMGRRKNEVYGKFDVDLAGFGDISQSEHRIFSLSMSPSGASVGKSLLRDLGYANYKTANDTVASGELRRLYHHLEHTGQVSFSDKEKLGAQDTANTIAEKIISAAGSMRENDPFAGVLKPTERMNISAPTEANFGLENVNSRAAARVKDLTKNFKNFHFYEVNSRMGRDKVGEYAASLSSRAVNNITANLIPNGFAAPGELDFALDDKKFVSTLVNKYHYTEKDAKAWYTAYNIQAEAQKQELTNLFAGILDNKGSIALDYAEDGSRTGRIFASIGKGDMVELHPERIAFEEGIFTVKTGTNQTRRVMPLGIFASGWDKSDDPRMIAGTMTTQRNTRYSRDYISNRIKNGIERGDAEGALEFLSGLSGSGYNKYTTEAAGEVTNARNALGFDFNDIVGHLDWIKDTKAIQDMHEAYKEIDPDSADYHHYEKFNELLEGKTADGKDIWQSGVKRNMHNLSSHYQNAFLHFQGDIKAALAEKMDAGKFPKDLRDLILNNVNFVTKHDSKGMGTVSTGTALAFEPYQIGASHAADKASRSHAIDVKRAEDLAGTVQEALNPNKPVVAEEIPTPKWGASVTTGFELARSTNEGAESGLKTETVIRGKRLAISTDDMRKIADDKGFSKYLRKGNDTDLLAKHLLETFSTDENAGAINPLTADLALGQRYWQKKAKMKDLMLDDKSVNDFITKDPSIHHAPVIHIDPNTGKISFTYTNGVLVHSDEAALHKLDYRGASAPLKATEDSFMKFRFFSGDNQVTEEKVTERLNQAGVQSELKQIYEDEVSSRINQLKEAHKNNQKAKGKFKLSSRSKAAIEAKAQDVVSVRALAMLENRGLAGSYLLESAHVSTNIKLMDEFEKTMGNNGMVAFGMNKDYKIGRFLGEQKLDKMIGHHYTLDVINGMLEKDEKTSEYHLKAGSEFMQLALDARMSKYSKEEIENNWTLKGRANNVKGFTKKFEAQVIQEFGSVKEFQNKIIQERYSAWRRLEQIFQGYGLTGKGSHIDVIADNSAGLLKHQDATAFSSTIANLMDEDIMGERKVDKAGKRISGAMTADDVVDTFNSKWTRKANGEVVQGEVKGKDNKVFSAAVPGLHTIKDANGADRLIFDNDAKELNIKSLDYIIKKNGLEKNTLLTDNAGLGITASYAQSNFRQNENVDWARITHIDKNGHLVGNGNAIKVDQRMVDNFLSERWSKGLKKDVMNSYTELYTQMAKDQNPGMSDSDAQDIGRQKAKDLYKKHMLHDSKGSDLINQGFMDDIMKHSYQSDGQTILSHDIRDVKNLSTDEMRAIQDLQDSGYNRKDINKAIASLKRSAEDRGLDISGATADKVAATISAASFGAANEFNKGARKSSIKYGKMLDNGFERISIDNATAYATAPTGADSVLGKQVLLDLHSDALEAKLGGRKLYKDLNDDSLLALPMSSLKWLERSNADHGVDGEVTLSKLDQKVGSLLQMQEEVLSSKTPLNDDERKRTHANMTNLIGDIRNDITQLTLGKGSVFRNIERAAYGNTIKGTAQAHIFKGSESKDGFWGNLEWEGNNLAAMARANKANGYFQYIEDGKGGKKLAKRGGVDVGYIVLGKNVKDQWFGQDYTDSIFGEGNEDMKKMFQEGLDERLSTKGTIGTNIRYPTVYNRSMSAAPVYVSNRVGDEDKIYTSERMHLAMKGDWDSDKVNVFLNRQDATIDFGNGNTRAIKIDYGGYQTLKNMEAQGVGNFSVNLSKSAEEFFEGAKRSIMVAASDVNPFAEAKQSVLKDNFNVMKQLGASSWDGQHISGYDDASILTSSQHLEHIKTYDKIRSKYIDEAHANGDENFTKYDISTAEGRRSANIEFNELERSKGGDAIRERMRDIAVDMGKAEGSKDAEDYTKNIYLGAMRHHHVNATSYDIVNASLMNSAAGYADNEMYKMYRLAEQAKDNGGKLLFDGDDMTIFRTMRTAIQEGTLTTKSEKGVGNALNNLINLGNAHREFMSALASNDSDKKAAASSNIEELYTNILKGRTKELGQLPQRLQVLDENGEVDLGATARKFAHRQAQMLEEISTRSSNTQEILKQFTNRTINKDASMWLLDGLVDTNLGQNAIKSVLDYAEEAGKTMPLIKGHGTARQILQEQSSQFGEEAARRMRETVESQGEAAEAAYGAAQVASKKLPGIAHAIAGMSHHGFAGMGVAVAAGLMTSGFASGPINKSKTQPAQGQAEAGMNIGAEQPAAAQPVPQLSDSNLNVMRGAPNKSYVININAQSSGGQAAAVQAVQSAISGSVPRGTSTNITMNTSAGGTISQYQLGHMIQNAMGL